MVILNPFFGQNPHHIRSAVLFDRPFMNVRHPRGRKLSLYGKALRKIILLFSPRNLLPKIRESLLKCNDQTRLCFSCKFRASFTRAGSRIWLSCPTSAPTFCIGLRIRFFIQGIILLTFFRCGWHTLAALSSTGRDRKRSVMAGIGCIGIHPQDLGYHGERCDLSLLFHDQRICEKNNYLRK